MLSARRKSLFQEISICHVNATARLNARNAVEHHVNVRYRMLNEAELKDATEERRLADEERKLAQLERSEASGTRAETRALLLQIRQSLQNLESDRMSTSWFLFSFEALDLTKC
jgi:hypothetical protein